ncbi:MAG: LPS export ABC transporter periplasmic protein LptC [Pseudomonadota bacterium]
MRIRTFIFGLALVAASIGTGWYHWSGDPVPTPQPTAGERLVESTLSSFVSTTYGAEGQRRNRVAADHLLRYTDGKEALLARPRFTLWPRDGGPEWRLAAPWGHWQPDAEEERLLLQEAVRVRRPAFGERPALGVDTRDLVILPDAERAHSDATTVLRRGGGTHLRGIGVEFDFQARRVRLLADVRGVHRDLGESDS